MTYSFSLLLGLFVFFAGCAQTSQNGSGASKAQSSLQAQSCSHEGCSCKPEDCKCDHAHERSCPHGANCPHSHSHHRHRAHMNKKLAKTCGCQEHKADKYIAHVRADETIGELKAPAYKHMHFSAQPTKADLKAAKEAGLQAVINLRRADELDWDEAAYVKELGLSYYNVPLLDANGEVIAENLPKLEEIHQKTHNQKQLIHCSTGNRAAAWMALHLHHKHKLSASESIKVAEKLGLTKDDLKAKLVSYMNDQK